MYGDRDATDQAIKNKWNDYLREWSTSCENGGGQAPYFLQQEIMDARRNVLLSHNSLDGGNEGGDVDSGLLVNYDNGDAFELEYSTLGQESDPFDDNVDDNLEWDDNREWQLMHHYFNDCLHIDPVAKLKQIAIRATVTKEQSFTPISCDKLNARQELFVKLIFELLSQEDA